MRLRAHTVLVFTILWIVTRGSAETAPGSDASNPFSLPAANTRQLRPARVEDDGSVPSELRESVTSIEKAFSKIANLGPIEPGDVPLARPSAASQSQHGRPSAVSSVPIPPGFQSAEFVDNLARERYNRRMAENGVPLPVSAVQVGSKATVAAPQKPLQQTATPVNPASPAKAAVLQKLTDLHKEMLGRIQYARQVAEVDEARFRARGVAKRKARRLRASEEDDEEDVDADSDGPVEADAREVGDNEDISSSLEADVKEDNNDADDSVATSKAAAVDAANQEFLQELLDTLHSNGLRGRRTRKRPTRRRKRPAKNDFSSLFGAKDPAASLLDILRDERRATVNMAAAAEAKQMAAGRATQNSQQDTPVSAAATPVTPVGPGYSLPVDTGDKAPLPMRMPGNSMRFTETKAGARDDGWSPPVPGDPVQADPFGPSMNSYGPSTQLQQAPQPMVVPPPAQQPMPLLQTQLQIQQQTAQLQQQLALQQSLQQQAAVIQQQQSFNQQMMAQQQSAQPQPMVNPPPLAANQVPPPPAAYFAAQQMAMQQAAADSYPPNANWQPGPQGYEMQPDAGGPPPNNFIPPP